MSNNYSPLEIENLIEEEPYEPFDNDDSEEDNPENEP
jgi:hypothetical protein